MNDILPYIYGAIGTPVGQFGWLVLLSVLSFSFCGIFLNLCLYTSYKIKIAFVGFLTPAITKEVEVLTLPVEAHAR